jgi:LCP family protein required for cell wall assembly
VDYIGERITRVEGGGPGLVSAVISQTLGISTMHWVRFEMTGFKDIVDAVGGVTVQLDCPFYEPILNLDTNSWDYFTLPAGSVHLDGEAAYWFVRLRLRESDIGRAERQRQFLWGLREQMMSTNLLAQIPALWTAFDSSISTDLTLLQIMDLARFGAGLDASNVRASGITLRELQSYTTERGAAVLVINDLQRVRQVIEGIWTAPAMADAYRKDVNSCSPVPDGVPVVASLDTPALSPSPLPTEVPILVPTPVVVEGAAVAPEPVSPPSGGG